MNTIFDLAGLITSNVWIYGGAFILVLSVLVFVHEFGHYYIARKCGVRVETFSIGFGRELFGVTDRHGTRWKFSLVPLGGYVKMFGDTDPASAGATQEVKDGETIRPMTEQERGEAFFSQPVAKRAAIVFAGPAINFLFAILVLAVLYMTYGQPVTPPQGAAIMMGSAAEEAGFRPHDEVVAIDGKAIKRFEDIRREVMIGLDTSRIFTIRRDGQIIELQATPRRQEEEDHYGFKQTRGLLGLIGPGNAIRVKDISAVNGVAVETEEEAAARLRRNMDRAIVIDIKRGEATDRLMVRPLATLNADFDKAEGEFAGILNISAAGQDMFVQHKPLDALFAAVTETRNITLGTLEAIGQIFTGTRSATELGGLIRIGALAGDMAKAGIIALVTFTALLSINLGLINLFPIPMLDGGHLVFYALEALKGNPIPEHYQEYAFRFGLVILVGIMLFANLNDIVQLIL